MKNCPICNEQVFQIPLIFNLPLSSAHLYKEICLDYNTTKFNAGVCKNCLHVFNTTPALTGVYENQGYITKVAVSQSMSTNLKNIKDWIISNLNTENLSKFKILEIGSGSGEIANWFDKSGATVYTVDPSIENYKDTNIIHEQRMFDSNYVKGKKSFDLIIARHVLEHIKDPKEFFTLLKRVIHEHTLVYIEVPNGLTSLKENRLVDYFNDHVHHYSPKSLLTLIQSCGFSMFNTLDILNENHQGMIIKLGTVNNNFFEHNIDIIDLIDQGKNKLSNILDHCNRAKKIIIYGAGAHAATFASQLSDFLKSKIVYIWDKDQRKLGRYLPGVTTAISLPQVDIDSDILIINTSVLYKNEVENFIRNDLSIKNIILHL